MTVPISLPICRKAACIGREKTSPGNRGAPRTAGRRRPRPIRALRFSRVPLLPPGGRSANLQAEQRRVRTELFATSGAPGSGREAAGAAPGDWRCGYGSVRLPRVRPKSSRGALQRRQRAFPAARCLRDDAEQ